MTALPVTTTTAASSKARSNPTSDHFLKLLPAVQAHARNKFRNLRDLDREEAIAEATAAAYLNFDIAVRHDKANTVTPGTLSRFAVLHVKAGRHVGGSQDRKRDVLSRLAQRRNGFRVYSLPLRDSQSFNCMTAPDQPVWREHLLHDRRTLPSDQAAFRIDWSKFLAGQSDRTRRTLAMLAEGYKQNEVADRLGVTPAAVCQRIKKARREWQNFQEVEAEDASRTPAAGGRRGPGADDLPGGVIRRRTPPRPARTGRRSAKAEIGKRNSLSAREI